MPLLYRAMLRDGQKPKVGPSKKTLGVKAGDDRHDDIAPDVQGNVAPGTGGMSVAPAWRDLPAHRIPRRLQPLCAKAAGNDNYVCWRMGEGVFKSDKLNDQLVLVVDRINHGTVQPARTMSLDGYQQALAATREQWSVDEE